MRSLARFPKVVNLKPKASELDRAEELFSPPMLMWGTSASAVRPPSRFGEYLSHIPSFPTQVHDLAIRICKINRGDALTHYREENSRCGLQL